MAPSLGKKKKKNKSGVPLLMPPPIDRSEEGEKKKVKGRRHFRFRNLWYGKRQSFCPPLSQNWTGKKKSDGVANGGPDGNQNGFFSEKMSRKRGGRKRKMHSEVENYISRKR